MPRRELVGILQILLPLWLMLFACALVLGACGPPRPERVVLVTIDTLRADHLGCYGGRSPTPNLDALAEAGARFETAIAPTPLTLPSHTSLLTGLEPPHHGVRNNSTFRLEEQFTTLAESFREAGFATAAFVAAVVLDRQYGLDQGFDVYDDQMGSRRATRHGLAERRADAVVDAVLAWLEAAPARAFLWVHLYDPHAEYDPPPAFRAVAPFSPYAGEIAFVDAHLGRLLSALDPATSLVAVTSDHGESLGEHGEPTHALTLYDATQRVPLLLRGPGVPPGAVVAELVGLVDVAPTLLELSGIDPLPRASGRSLAPLLAGGSLPESPVYSETLSTQLDLGWSPLFAVRTPQYKYIRAPRPELYALAEDPRELENLALERPDRVAELDAALDEKLARALPVQPSVTPSAEERARLESLGYLVTDPQAPSDTLGRVEGLDPKDGLADYRVLLRILPLLRRGQGEQALAALQQVNTESFLGALIGAETGTIAGRHAVAERHARQAIALQPAHSASHLALGRVLERAGRREEARRVYEYAREIDPASGEAVVALGRLAEDDGELEAANELYAAAAETRSAPGESFWRRAALRIEAGDDAGAAALLERAAGEGEREPEAVLRLARAERRVGRPEAARRRLRAALESTPGHVQLEQALTELEEAGS